MNSRVEGFEKLSTVKQMRLFGAQPDVMSVSEAAKLLGVSIDTVRREIARGSLRSAKVGRRVLVTKTALIHYLGEEIYEW